LGVARVLQVRVGDRRVDVPVFLDAVRLVGLILVGLDDELVELFRLGEGFALFVVGPILGLGLRVGSCERLGIGLAIEGRALQRVGFRLFFFAPAPREVSLTATT